MSSPDFRRLPVVDPEAIEALQHARHGDPFSLLGPHPGAQGLIVRAFLPGALHVELIEQQGEGLLGSLQRVHAYGLYEGRLPQALAAPQAYRLRIHWPGAVQVTEDPYAFPAMLDEHDLARFSAGHNWHIGRMLGAHTCSLQGVPGVRFAVWAPSARAVSVVGDFNAWDARRLPMRLRYPSGVWELFVPRLEAGACYKFHIHGRWGPLPLKADPVALQTEKPPSTGSIVARDTGFVWNDAQWLHERGAHQRADAPLSIYEVHAGSWLREAQDLDAAVTSTWKLLTERLVPYAHAMGFTHIELMPVAEHPFGGSWGYQPLGLFAPTARYGTPDEFRHFIDACHGAGLGVIVDWVPAHFPTDVYGLARFDGTALYEHEDPREGYHPDWNTAIYNLGRNEVKSFLISSAMEWIERYHVDGLRVDAVASMLYRDYSRQHGEWVPNVHGGRENLEAIEFLRTFNSVVATHHPDVITVAEESTAWPGVTHGVAYGGLGFSYKWNMGWMHDTLSYMQKDPIYRSYHHEQITFGLLYAFSERFVLPISHDEVVHLKRSLLDKMPGDAWQRLANLRLYLGLMWGYPGKKLLFMGAEIGQQSEWSHDHELDWYLLDDPRHQGVQRWLRDLNGVYREHGALHRKDAEAEGFQWAVVDDRQNCVFAFLRRGAHQDPPVLVVLNMTPVPRYAYRIGVAEGGVWRELLNSDSEHYGGSNLGNHGAVRAEDVPAHAQPASLVLTLPPLSALFLQARAGR